MKAVYFYMDTVVAVKSLWNGKRFVTAKWDGKRWRILTYKSMPSVASREKAEENLQRRTEKDFHMRAVMAAAIYPPAYVIWGMR